MGYCPVYKKENAFYGETRELDETIEKVVKLSGHSNSGHPRPILKN